MLNTKISSFVLPLVLTLSLQANNTFIDDPFGDDIFKEMMQMQGNMDKMFERMHNRIQQRSSHIINPIARYSISQTQNFVDKKDHYEYITNIPQNKENQININTKDGIMSISAKIIEKQEKKTKNSFSSSSSMRMYQESIPLPKDADENSINVEYKNKKLVISLKKLKNIPKPQTNIHINGKAMKISDKDNNGSKENNKTLK